MYVLASKKLQLHLFRRCSANYNEYHNHGVINFGDTIEAMFCLCKECAEIYNYSLR